MGAALVLEPDTTFSVKIHVLKDLQAARTGLIKGKTRLCNRGQTQINTVLKRQTKTRLTLVARQIAELDKEIASLIAEDKTIARKRDILRSTPIPSLGPVATALILTFLPEIGALDRKQAGSLAGLVPYNLEPGTWKGKSFISGGRKPLRDALYMPSSRLTVCGSKKALLITDTLH